jgi:hypothetical protein
MACCTRHQMYPVTDISGWFHRTGPQVLVPVRVWAEELGQPAPDPAGQRRLSATATGRAPKTRGLERQALVASIRPGRGAQSLSFPGHTWCAGSHQTA